MINANDFDPKAEPTEDKVHRVVRAAIGALPVLSGTALEMLNSIIEYPYQRRRTKWLHALTSAINAVEVDIKHLKEDSQHSERVLSVILQSTDIVLKTGDMGIHNRLIQLVLNTIRSRDLKEDLLALYLATVRQMTSSHFALLWLISNRTRYEQGAELREYESAFFKEISDCPEISRDIPSIRLLKDLESMQLIYSPEGSPVSVGGSTNYCTMTLSEFCKGFLRHVT